MRRGSLRLTGLGDSTGINVHNGSQSSKSFSVKKKIMKFIVVIWQPNHLFEVILWTFFRQGAGGL